MFVLSLRLIINENAIDVDGNSLENLLNVGQKVYIISDTISSNMNYEIIWFFLDYYIQFL